MTTTTAAPAVATDARTAYLAAVNAKGLNVVNVEWTSEVKPAAAHKARVLRKRVKATALTGVSFAGLAVNADREKGALPWGEWVEYPYLITHKGTDYARLNVVEGSIRTEYVVDGIPVDRDTFLGYLTPSAANAPKPVGGTITVKLENLIVGF